MKDETVRSIDRRRVLTAVGAGGTLLLAGCLGGDDDDDAQADDGDTDDGTDDTGVDDDETGTDNGDDGDDHDDEEQTTIQALVELFDDQPFNDDQLEIEGENRSYTPHHVWKWVSDDTFIALHVNEPNPEEADGLMYVVVGKKGAFTEESKPGEEFTHFHSYEADSWEAGHGGGGDGYWLTHIAVDDLEMPWGDVEVGVDRDFMPTDAPE